MTDTELELYFENLSADLLGKLFENGFIEILPDEFMHILSDCEYCGSYNTMHSSVISYYRMPTPARNFRVTYSHVCLLCGKHFIREVIIDL